jgi:hypothetical protein
MITYFNPEDGGNTFLRNVGNHLQDGLTTQKKTTIDIFSAVRASNLRQSFADFKNNVVGTSRMA